MSKPYFVATAALLMAATTAAAAVQLAGKAALSKATYQPLESVSYVLGSKAATGYFLSEAGSCKVTLMIAEAVDPDLATPPSAARLRLSLEPGQGAGLDSEEGPFVDLTCGEAAGTLIVYRGEDHAAIVAN